MSNAFMVLTLLFLLAVANTKSVSQVTDGNRVKNPDAPPIIVISDTGQYKFKSGSAKLPLGLRSYIENSLVNAIEENARKYNIDVIEVIGHTDGQRIGDGSTNLDDKLELVAAGRNSVSILNPASNADLGLMRSLAVVQLLQKEQKQGRLEGLGFRPYSAAQLLLPDGKFASVERHPNDARRRIEIRFTQLGKEQKVR